ncbi:MAG: DUF4911 domain-containing protein [Desulfobulbaceae bacterium]|nr:DUF4911 domain-containing protein [Desulfobulbaceae bacterium]
MDRKPARLSILFARIAIARVAFLKFILEGYDGLAGLTTIDRKNGLVAMACFPDCREELVALLDSLNISTVHKPTNHFN